MADEYCDLVMKGGITSGIVYPNAVLALARRYRFKNIGGTSAGAIAAAACAAAALGERRRQLAPETVMDAPDAGLDGLARVADQLRTRGFIYGLFQPARYGRAAFRLIVTLAAGPATWKRVLAILRAIVAIAPIECLATLGALLALGWLVAGSGGLLAALPPALLCALLLGAVAAGLRFARVVRGNRLGLCSGMGAANDPPALTEWLYGVLQRLSGQHDRPLLFGDLWEAPRYSGEPPAEKALSLAVITTGVSHHEPRSLPFEGSSFWFAREDFDRLFPRALVDWMAEQDQSPLTIRDRRYYRLPRGAQLPVIVAARMSLSFPILISAVPLYEAAEWERTRPDAPEADEESPALASADALATGGYSRDSRPASLRICWFADGGIASNFPIHLFDAALPRWPTFAIDLTYPDSAAADAPAIDLPSRNNLGWQPRYQSFASAWAAGELAGFLFAIIATMQNWRDLLQSRAPGHRDRIVHIALAGDEGGMNLDMSQEVLDRIAAKGSAAGETLVDKFDFDNHWWVRWRNAASGIERFTIELARGGGTPVSASYAVAHASATTGTPPPPSYPFTRAQQDDAQTRLAAMVEQGELWADTDPDLTKGAPRPLPQLRLTPTF